MVRVIEVMNNVYQIDLEPGGFSNLVSVYAINTGKGIIVFEGGPAVSSNDLRNALRGGCQVMLLMHSSPMFI